MKHTLNFLLFLVLATAARAQVGVGTTSPHASAALDVSAANKGLLPPRMSWTDIQAIPNPAAGLLVYDLTSQGIRLYNGQRWMLLGERQRNRMDAPGTFLAPIIGEGTASVRPQDLFLLPNGDLLLAGYYSQGSGTLLGGTLPPTSIYPSAFFCKISSQGNLIWLRTIGSAATDTRIKAITADASGNVYVAGSFSGTVDMDPGNGIQNMTPVGGYDGFYSKYTSSGIWAWSQQVGGSSTDEVTRLACNGSILYIGGPFFSTNGTFLNSTLSSVGSTDIFIARCQTSNGLQGTSGWVRQFSGTMDESLANISVSPTGIVAAGYFKGTGSFASASLTSAGSNYDGYVVQLTAAGSVSTATRIGSTGSDVINDVATDAAGNIYLAGTFSNTVGFDPLSSTGNYTATGSDGFLAKYNATMGYEGLVHLSGDLTEVAQKLALDASGNVYLSGRFTSGKVWATLPRFNTPTANAEDFSSLYLLKLNSSLTPQWIQAAGGFSNSETNGIAVDGAGTHVYTAAYLTGAPAVGYDHQQLPGDGFFLFRYEE